MDDDSLEPSDGGGEVISTRNMETEDNLNAANSIIEEGAGSSSSDSSNSSGNSQHRAKAFILNTENNDWEEMATGICSPEPSEVMETGSVGEWLFNALFLF